MRFYNRQQEIETLRTMREQAYESHSKFTVVTGRRRVGKTSLIKKAMSGEDFIYLFVGRKSEGSLCDGYVKEMTAKLGVFVPKMSSFADVFRFIMEQGISRRFTVVIDEFQEFLYINPSVYSDMQDIWDDYRTRTHVNLVVSGSVYSLMVRLFQDKKEPLFGRADRTLKLKAFTTSVLKEIMHDNHPEYTNDDLLALFAFTGGIPKYVELLVDNKALSVDQMIRFICNPDSPFREEGKNLLIEEFGKKYATYFSILDAIASGSNTQSEIESMIGEKSIGGHLSKLETVYEVINKKRPIMSKPGSQTVKYDITDLFLKFWFRYFEGNRSLLEIGNYKELNRILQEDYSTYSGKILEAYFIEVMKESEEYREIGSFWEFKKGKEQNEIDIIAISTDKKIARVVEVKRQKKNFNEADFMNKVAHVKNKILGRYAIKTDCLTLDDM